MLLGFGYWDLVLSNSGLYCLGDLAMRLVVLWLLLDLLFVWVVGLFVFVVFV